MLVDLGRGQDRDGWLGARAGWQQMGSTAPDVSPEDVHAFFELMKTAKDNDWVLAYHDRSDGGLLVTLLEMAFAGRCGLQVDLDVSPDQANARLFSEEAGAVLQVAAEHVADVLACAEAVGLGHAVTRIATPRADGRIVVNTPQFELIDSRREALQSLWAETSHAIARVRDNAECADQEFAAIQARDPGLSAQLSYDCDADIAAPFIATGQRPRIAVLREQGVNGQMEMAAAFDRAGFTAVDVHMSDVIAGRQDLSDCHGLAACGGFSYGDVLGAGEGWAKSILFNEAVRSRFEQFFARTDTFALGVCNGCQMLSALQEIIPGTDHWPRFARNRSSSTRRVCHWSEWRPRRQCCCRVWKARTCPLSWPMERGALSSPQPMNRLFGTAGLVAMRFIDHDLQLADTYPYNPNGSPDGITGLCNEDGRVTIMMPHPERVFRAAQLSWRPPNGKPTPAGCGFPQRAGLAWVTVTWCWRH